MAHNLVNFYYHRSAWETAFLNTDSKIVLAFSGAVFKDVIAIETLVNDSLGNPGAAGIPATNELSIFANRDEGMAFDGAVHVNIKDVKIMGNQINLVGGEVLYNEWRHATVVVDDSLKIAKLYLDGEKIAEVEYDGTTTLFSSVRNAIIGRHSYISFQGFEYTGNVDDFRIYPKPLTDEQIMDVYKFGNQKLEFDEKVYVPPAGVHKGKTASFKFESQDFMKIRQLAIQYQQGNIR